MWVDPVKLAHTPLQFTGLEFPLEMCDHSNVCTLGSILDEVFLSIYLAKVAHVILCSQRLSLTKAASEVYEM